MKCAGIAVLIATTAAAALVAAAPARASLEVGMEDETLLLSGDLGGPFAAADWSRLGVDIVRVHAHWWSVAPSAKSTKRPSGFHPTDPNDPKYSWGPVDHSVQTVLSQGMKVMLTITGPGPVWASSSPKKHNQAWKPKAKDFANFATAVAKRYGASVDRYLIYNEPNQKGWLQPQWHCVKKRHHRRTCSAVSPHTYRALVRAAVPAVHKADRGSETVIGELAPVGNNPISDETPMKPLVFLRAMGCVNDRYKSIRTGACKHFKAAQGDSFGYHPHPKKLAPDKPNKDKGDAQMGDLKRLFTTLDKLTHRHRIRAKGSRFKIRMTEFGYETNPPDRSNGVSLKLQTRYLQQAAYIVWKTRRIESLAYYQWTDEPVRNLGHGGNRYGNYQTGLTFKSGKAKPVLSTFAAPFVIDLPAKRASGLFWGQVRPAANRTVTIQMRRKGASTWTDVTKLSMGSDGTWSKRIKVVKNASYRYSFTRLPSLFYPTPQPEYSGVVNLASKLKSPLKAAAAQ
jgi:hypothetical protein